MQNTGADSWCADSSGADSCRWYHLAIAIVSAILFTMFLIYDLQMLMGGRAREFDPDMYVIAALNIYIDIIQIFLNVLQIIGIAGGGD